MGKLSITKQILEEHLIQVVFHPVISLRRQKIVGLEALCCANIDGQRLEMEKLREIARKEKNLLQFERFVRRYVMQAFTEFVASEPEFVHLVLFISFESSLVDSGVVGSGNITGLAKEFGIKPNRIALEINDSKVSNLDALREFTTFHKEHGFIILLDGIGAGASTFERITFVEPDIMALGASRIALIEKEFYKRGVVKSIAELAKSMGSLFFCKGIEKMRDALMCLDVGAELLSGKFFYDPEKDGEIHKEVMYQRITSLDRELKSYHDAKLSISTKLYTQFNLLAGKIAHQLSITEPSKFERRIRAFIKENATIECIYLLDINGVKILESLFAPGKRAINRKTIFKPAHLGTDHSSKDYYYNVIRSSAGIYISEPYISAASGNLCITVSTIFMDENAKKYILCIDFDSHSTNRQLLSMG